MGYGLYTLLANIFIMESLYDKQCKGKYLEKIR